MGGRAHRNEFVHEYSHRWRAETLYTLHTPASLPCRHYRCWQDMWPHGRAPRNANLLAPLTSPNGVIQRRGPESSGKRNLRLVRFVPLTIVIAFDR